MGKTTDPLNGHTNGHRSGFYSVLKNFCKFLEADSNYKIDINTIDVEQILGGHLLNSHRKILKPDFNEIFDHSKLSSSALGT